MHLSMSLVGPGLGASRALPPPPHPVVLAPLFECKDEGTRTVAGRLAWWGISGPDGRDHQPPRDPGKLT